MADGQKGIECGLLFLLFCCIKAGTTLLTVAIMGAWNDRLGIFIGPKCSPAKKDLQESFWFFLVFLPIMALAEEAVFRFLPGLALDWLGVKTGAGLWVAGVVVSVVFAMFHGFGRIEGEDCVDFGGAEDKSKSKRIGLYAVPLPQFLSGLVFWGVYMYGGFLMSWVVHTTHNISILCLTKIKELQNSAKKEEDSGDSENQGG